MNFNNQMKRIKQLVWIFSFVNNKNTEGVLPLYCLFSKTHIYHANKLNDRSH
jgi:hypothetical protein